MLYYITFWDGADYQRRPRFHDRDECQIAVWTEAQAKREARRAYRGQIHRVPDGIGQIIERPNYHIWAVPPNTELLIDNTVHNKSS